MLDIKLKICTFYFTFFKKLKKTAIITTKM